MNTHRALQFQSWWIHSLIFCAALALTSVASGGGTDQPEFVNPPEVRSDNGVLKAKWDVKPTRLEIGGKSINSFTFAGLYVPPTLRMNPGDTVELDIDNLSDRPTNIHFHGMTVSPLYNGDNIFVRIDPGHQFNYRFVVPKTHVPGMYWYHAHAHGFAERQVMYGFTGAVIVEGAMEQDYPDLKSIEEKILVLKDIQVSPFGNVPQDVVTSRAAIRTVNGLVNPILCIKPGETQFWRISNQSANLYHRLTLGGNDMWVVREDGNPVIKMFPVKEYLLGPSARVEVLVQLNQPWQIELVSEKGRTGPAGDGYSRTVLMTVRCEGEAVEPIQLPVDRNCCAPPVEDYRQLNIDNKRLIVFNETDNDFRVNNMVFNEDRIDTRVALGTVEEWTIRNATDELHQFHIHQMDFQMVEMNGKPVEFTGHRDNIVVPIRGEVKLIMPFTDPVMVGNFVYHCHIVEHEDGGMMAIIQVYDPKNPDAIPAPWEHVVVPPANAQAQGGTINLTDQNGKEWTPNQTSAQLMLVSFGYTNCKYACPRTQTLLNQTMDLLAADAKQVQPVMVTIDPQRDTPGTLHEYVEHADFSVVALTGSAADIARVAGEYGVAYKQLPPQPDGSYGMSHSTDVFLTTREGRIIERFDLITSAEKIADKAREVLSAQAMNTQGGAK